MNEQYEAISRRLDNIEEDLRQSNSVLHRIERRSRFALVFSSLKWFIIIGLSLGTFYYTKPYLDQLMQTYSQISNIGSFLQ